MDLMLLESQDDVIHNYEKIKKFKGKIISLSISSHSKLKKMNIQHELLDNYFEEKDKDLIDYEVVKITKNWYKDERIKKNLVFNGMNIGNLMESENISFFQTTIRLVIGIKRVLEKENTKKIFCNDLFNFVSIFNSKNQFEILRLNERKIIKNKKIQISYDFRNKTYSIKISEKNFKKIKTFIENFSIKKHQKFLNFSNKKTILLLDFNSVNFSTLLNELSSKYENICLLNQRRPAIWNKESYEIIKKSKCNVISLENFNDKETKKKILKSDHEFQKKIELIKDNDMSEIFSIEGFSYWNTIKNQLMEEIEIKSSYMIKNYILAEKMMAKIYPNAILEWSLNGFEEKIINNLAFLQQLPIIYLQHAKLEQSTEFDKFMQIHPVIPEFNAIQAVWGKVDQDFLLKKGVDSKQIIVTGSPAHDQFFSEKLDIKNDGTIIIATSGFANAYTFEGNKNEYFRRLEEVIRTSISTINQLKNKKPIIKLHPGKSKLNIKEIITDIDPKIPIFSESKAIDLLKKCDLLISTDFSTILLDALILNKPTIFVPVQEQKQLMEPMVSSGAVHYVDKIEKLEEEILKIFNDNAFKNKLIKKGKQHVEKYLEYQGCSGKKLAEVFENF